MTLEQLFPLQQFHEGVQIMTAMEILIARNKKILDRWSGYDARMLELTRSHATLRILIQGEDQTRNLVVSCLGPTFISGPTSWVKCVLSLKPVTLPGGREGIGIFDEENCVQIIGESFEVAENCKLKKV